MCPCQMINGLVKLLPRCFSSTFSVLHYPAECGSALPHFWLPPLSLFRHPVDCGSALPCFWLPPLSFFRHPVDWFLWWSCLPSRILPSSVLGSLLFLMATKLHVLSVVRPRVPLRPTLRFACPFTSRARILQATRALDYCDVIMCLDTHVCCCIILAQTSISSYWYPCACVCVLFKTRRLEICHHVWMNQPWRN